MWGQIIKQSVFLYYHRSYLNLIVGGLLCKISQIKLNQLKKTSQFRCKWGLLVLVYPQLIGSIDSCSVKFRDNLFNFNATVIVRSALLNFTFVTQSERPNCYLTINYNSDLSGLDTNLTPTDSRHLKSASPPRFHHVHERFIATEIFVWFLMFKVFPWFSMSMFCFFSKISFFHNGIREMSVVEILAHFGELILTLLGIHLSVKRHLKWIKI